MKTGSGIKTLAMKVGAEAFEQNKALALTVLGGREVYTEPGLAVFQLEDGRIIELYGPGSSYPACLFEKNELVISFRVADVQKAVDGMIRAGMEVIYGIQRLGTCSAHCYVRDQSGTVFGLTD